MMSDHYDVLAAIPEEKKLLFSEIRQMVPDMPEKKLRRAIRTLKNQGKIRSAPLLLSMNKNVYIKPAAAEG